MIGQIFTALCLVLGEVRNFLFISFFLFNLFNSVEFSDANAKFYCRLYYAGEFHKMREVVLGSSEEDFIRSLSHSSPWQARGGKSGAAFYATEGNSVYSH